MHSKDFGWSSDFSRGRSFAFLAARYSTTNSLMLAGCFCTGEFVFCATELEQRNAPKPRAASQISQILFINGLLVVSVVSLVRDAIMDNKSSPQPLPPNSN